MDKRYGTQVTPFIIAIGFLSLISISLITAYPPFLSIFFGISAGLILLLLLGISMSVTVTDRSIILQKFFGVISEEIMYTDFASMTSRLSHSSHRHGEGSLKILSITLKSGSLYHLNNEQIEDIDEMIEDIRSRMEMNNISL